MTAEINVFSVFAETLSVIMSSGITDAYKGSRLRRSRIHNLQF